MDALWFGCIPVFLANHYVPPLYGLIPVNTRGAGNMLSCPCRDQCHACASQVGSLKEILESVSMERTAAFQRNILAVRAVCSPLFASWGLNSI